MTKSISMKKETVPIIDSEMVLEEVLQQITKTNHYFVLVKDSKNKIIGQITLKELLNGIQRPRQEIKKYAQLNGPLPTWCKVNFLFLKFSGFRAFLKSTTTFPFINFDK